MIIKIEDAPAVKHITIDIDFTGDGKTTIVKDGVNVGGDKQYVPSYKDEALDLDADFQQATEDVVQKPDITEKEERTVNVSEEMQNAEF